MLFAAAALLLTPMAWDHLTAGASQGEPPLTQDSLEIGPSPSPTAEEVTKSPMPPPPSVPVPEPLVTSISISAIGDCTLGSGIGFAHQGSIGDYYDRFGPEYFFQGVTEVLSTDDLTIANLEGPLTQQGEPTPKTFNFRAPAEYVEIVKLGGVEAVTLANNHSMDYGEIGFQDTQATLDQAGITHFGFDDLAVVEVKGIRIGLLGDLGWDNTEETRSSLAQRLQELDADIKIVSFHWGIEGEHTQNAAQVSLAHFAIDSGADLVLGHHPHVLQGVETYNGRLIAYSLGNFAFGGNQNPSDTDSMIFQVHFELTGSVVTGLDSQIIPVSISSIGHPNDYSPVVLDGAERDRVERKVLGSSTNYPV